MVYSIRGNEWAGSDGSCFEASSWSHMLKAMRTLPSSMPDWNTFIVDDQSCVANGYPYSEGSFKTDNGIRLTEYDHSK